MNWNDNRPNDLFSPKIRSNNLNFGRSSGSPIFGPSHPPAGGQWQNSEKQYRLTAAGTAPDLHRIPFLRPFSNTEKSATKTMQM
jgi:hypothetical protein